jgi:hypothetical protein
MGGLKSIYPLLMYLMESFSRSRQEVTLGNDTYRLEGMHEACPFSQNWGLTGVGLMTLDS